MRLPSIYTIMMTQSTIFSQICQCSPYPSYEIRLKHILQMIPKLRVLHPPKTILEPIKKPLDFSKRVRLTNRAIVSCFVPKPLVPTSEKSFADEIEERGSGIEAALARPDPWLPKVGSISVLRLHHCFEKVNYQHRIKDYEMEN